jgi:hypothetical protein
MPRQGVHRRTLFEGCCGCPQDHSPINENCRIRELLVDGEKWGSRVMIEASLTCSSIDSEDRGHGAVKSDIASSSMPELPPHLPHHPAFWRQSIPDRIHSIGRRQFSQPQGVIFRLLGCSYIIRGPKIRSCKRHVQSHLSIHSRRCAVMMKLIVRLGTAWSSSWTDGTRG